MNQPALDLLCLEHAASPGHARGWSSPVEFERCPMNRLALSSLCWEHAGDPAQAIGWSSLGIEGLEAVPGKMLPSWPELVDTEAMAALHILEQEGLQVPAMQAFLFKKPQARLFEESASFSRAVMDAARLAALWRSPYLVWGAPSSRLRGGMTQDEAVARAVQTLRPLCDHIHSAYGVMLLVEHNPQDYGCDFIVTPSEAALLVEAVDSKGFGMHLDIGGLGDDDQVSRWLGQCRHVHASERGLRPFEDSVRHQEAASATAARDGEWVSLEMLPPPGGRAQAEAAASAFVARYGRGA